MASLKPIPQARLQTYWHAAAAGRLCPWEQAKALAFREASKEIHNGTVKLDWVASKLTKNGGWLPTEGLSVRVLRQGRRRPSLIPRQA